MERSVRTLQFSNAGLVNIPDELQVLDDGQQPEKGQTLWRFLSQKDGDKRIVWSRGSIPEINAARQMFLDCVAQGMTPYRVGVGGKASADVMTEFDASAEEVIFMPTAMITGG
jgi:ABC-type Fe3+ transport system substrate-binding protein